VPSTFMLVTETPYPVEALFDVSLDIDAHMASMAASGERAVAGVTALERPTSYAHLLATIA